MTNIPILQCDKCENFQISVSKDALPFESRDFELHVNSRATVQHRGKEVVIRITRSPEGDSVHGVVVDIPRVTGKSHGDATIGQEVIISRNDICLISN